MSGFPPSLFAGARFAVVGLGRMGLPAARALAGVVVVLVAYALNYPMAKYNIHVWTIDSVESAADVIVHFHR